MRTTGTARRWVLGAMMAGSPGFGAAQAFAGPTAAEEGAGRCSPSNCTVSCQMRGAAGGDCFNGVCVCWST